MHGLQGSFALITLIALALFLVLLILFSPLKSASSAGVVVCDTAGMWSFHCTGCEQYKRGNSDLFTQGFDNKVGWSPTKFRCAASKFVRVNTWSSFVRCDDDSFLISKGHFLKMGMLSTTI